jgi:5'-methylthioadenosine phosphorylase
MTAMPEAKLAREAEICYATLACVTDYDCWHPSYGSVTAEMIIDNLSRDVELSRSILKTVMTRIPEKRECGCASALKDALVTSSKRIPAQKKKDLSLLIGKYIDVS